MSCFPRQITIVLLTIGFFSLITGCASTTQGGLVGADRTQLMLTDSQSINTQAAQAYNQYLQKARQEKVLNTDAKMLVRVRNIVDHLAPETAYFRQDAPRWQWEANIIHSNELNAFCYPGGKIIVYTGIVNKLELTDNELAAILGHEIAHALREHSREQSSQDALIGILAAIARQKIGNLADYAGQGVMLKNSRTAETEADRIGIELMARAGYNPDAAVTLWQKMARVSEGKEGISWLSTHPSSSDRIRVLQQDAQTVKPLYETAKAKRMQIDKTKN